MRTLFCNASILTMSETGPGFFRRGFLAVEEDKIVSACETEPAVWAPDRRVEASNRLILPGLVNAHTHAAMSLLRGYADDLTLQEWLFDKVFPVEDRMSDGDVYWGTLLSLAEMTRAGVTSFADMYIHMDRVAQATVESGLRASLARGLSDRSGERGIAESRALHAGWEGAGDGRITLMLGPHAVYTCSPAFLARVAEVSAELRLPVHIHLAENRQEVEECLKTYGVRPVELVRRAGLFERPVLLAHGVHLTLEEIKFLAGTRTTVAHNPLSNQKLASGIAPVDQMLCSGLQVALGTDGPASSNTLDIFEAGRHAALLQKVATGDPTALPAVEIVRMATAAGAGALALKDRVGRLEPGCQADFILIDLDKPHLCPTTDPYSLLVYAARAEDVDSVYVQGRALMEKRKLLVLDEERIMAECRRRAAALWS